MKKFLLLFAALLTLGMTARAADGDEFTVDNLRYQVLSETEHEASLIGWFDNKPTGDLSIPAEVTNNGNSYSVTEIGYNAFFFCTGLTSVTIPNSVTEIVGGAFSNCDRLTSVTIPNSVINIGERPFVACTSLQEIVVDNGNKNYTSIDGVLYDSRIMELITYPAGKEGAFDIPNSVTNIGVYAFSLCSGLTSVTIPNSVTGIGESAFSSCEGLISVTIPNSVTDIGRGAFSHCTRLISVTIPNSVTDIGEAPFSLCWSLQEIVVDNGNKNYTSIDGVLYDFHITELITYPAGKEGAFDIPNSVTNIGVGAFSYCTGLTSVTIPNSVIGIGTTAFYFCRSLQEIVVENGNKNYTSIDGVLYDSHITELITYPAGKEGAFDIPNSVTNIGVGAFYYCSGLTSVTIPNSVTNIGNAAFGYCESLTSVTIPNSVTNIGDWAFGGCSGLTTIMSRPTTPPACYSRTFGNVPQSAVVYIPKGTLNEYAAAEGWNYFTDFRETEDSGIDGVEAGSDTASAEFFRLNGMRVKGGALAPGVYLKRQGGNVTKVLVK